MATTSRNQNLPPELVAELESIAADQGCELAHIEFAGAVLRLVLDRPDEGITLADCEAVSRQASAVLDVADFGRARYTLEVSSPGLDRELYGPKDYARFVGRLARVTFQAPEAKTKRTITGRLESFREEGGCEIEVRIADTGERLVLPLSQIQKARLEIEL